MFKLGGCMPCIEGGKKGAKQHEKPQGVWGGGGFIFPYSPKSSSGWCCWRQGFLFSPRSTGAGRACAALPPAAHTQGRAEEKEEAVKLHCSLKLLQLPGRSEHTESTHLAPQASLGQPPPPQQHSCVVWHILSQGSHVFTPPVWIQIYILGPP